eukprot:GEMP01003446.1.p1 GENE.GEMP01003446.1~~GEMP01003446.1.p1  ORF type:complete len:238 (+),score=17.83 GEMP01003446.1:248-961(+)
MNEDTFLRAVTEILIKNVDTRDDCESKRGTLLFDSSTIPPIGIGSYLIRLHKYFDCSQSCHVLALIYLDHFARACDDFALTVRNVHRLYLASLVLAAKFWEDMFYDNTYYAKCGGVRLVELNRLELAFLSVVKFKLWVSLDEFKSYLRVFSIKEDYFPTMPRPSLPRRQQSLSVLETCLAYTPILTAHSDESLGAGTDVLIGADDSATCRKSVMTPISSLSTCAERSDENDDASDAN